MGLNAIGSRVGCIPSIHHLTSTLLLAPKLGRCANVSFQESALSAHFPSTQPLGCQCTATQIKQHLEELTYVMHHAKLHKNRNWFCKALPNTLPNTSFNVGCANILGPENLSEYDAFQVLLQNQGHMTLSEEHVNRLVGFWEPLL